MGDSSRAHGAVSSPFLDEKKKIVISTKKNLFFFFISLTQHPTSINLSLWLNHVLSKPPLIYDSFKRKKRQYLLFVPNSSVLITLK